jgi:RsmE family RNA methyltransferase
VRCGATFLGVVVNLILIEPEELESSGEVTLADGRARHILSVLRAVPEQTIRLGVVNGPIGKARVVSVDRERGQVSLAYSPDDVPPVPAVDLLLAVPRPKVLRRLWAQIAALGVRRIVLTNAARVERNYFDTHMLDSSVYRPLLLEGLQQAKDTHLPIVSVHRQFRVVVEDHLEQMTGPSTRLVAHPAAPRRITEALAGQGAPPRVVLAVGPEGGWNQFELDLLAAHGFTAVDMGPRTLRSDTACIALLALVHDALRR